MRGGFCALTCGLTAMSLLFFIDVALADGAILGASKDAGLYNDPGFDFGNGAGQHMIAGRTNAGNLRRALVAFDLAGSIPAGSTITSVQLRLHMSRTSSTGRTVSLHRITLAWNEGPSDAGDNEGTGEPAVIGDTTWLHTYYDSQFWSRPGGDYVSAPSASLTVAGDGFYMWTSNANLVADAQLWLDDPAQNHGWILIGVEGSNRTTKRFDTRENPTASFRPQLLVTFNPPPPPPPGDMNCDGIVSPSDIAGFVLALSNPAEYAVQYPNCDANNADMNGDDVVTPGDIAGFVQALSGG